MIDAGAKPGRAVGSLADAIAGAEPAGAAGTLARALGVALLLAGMLGAPALTAGEAPAGSEGQAAAASAESEAEDAGAAAGGKAPPGETGAAAGSEADGKGGDVFVPTEEISEDFAVSFPVDI